VTRITGVPSRSTLHSLAASFESMLEILMSGHFAVRDRHVNNLFSMRHRKNGATIPFHQRSKKEPVSTPWCVLSV
jgi:hypothetical protein